MMRIHTLNSVFLVLVAGMLAPSLLMTAEARCECDTACIDDELLKKDILRSKIEAHQLIEIKSRLNSGDVAGAERLVDSFLDVVYQELSVLKQSGPGEDDSSSIDSLLIRTNDISRGKE